jgi:Uncharacterized conserved protein (DUF2285)
VLDTAPVGCNHARSIDLEVLGTILSDHTANDERHVVIAGDKGHHRIPLLDIRSESQLAVILPISVELALGLASAARFDRLLRCVPTGHLWEYQPTSFKRNRLVLQLGLLDAEVVGASRREMASALLYRNSTPMGRAEWKGSSQRRRTHRMIDEAKYMMAHGYRNLLLGR